MRTQKFLLKKTASLARGIVLGACLGSFLLAAPAWAGVKVAGIFSDNMVVQRDRPVPVWGWSDPGDEITVTFAGQTKTVTAVADRSWRINLDAMEASSEPRVMVVHSKTGNTDVRFANVLVGEVWLCAGQSNMALTLPECFNGTEEVAAANDPLLRFVAMPSALATLPVTDGRSVQWKVCTPETASDCSGVGYFFVRNLRRNLQVPVGLIKTVYMSTIEGYIPLAGYQASAVPAMQALFREAASWDPQSEIGRQAHQEAFAKIEAWVSDAKAALAAGKPVPPEPLLPAPSKHLRSGPTTIYNGTIVPVVPYALRGVIWYQGEANAGEGESYELKLRTMITGWRKVWGQGDFPFYLALLANEGNTVDRPDEEATFRYVPTREAQRRVLSLPHTGLAVTIDVGEDTQGHPRNKRDVGERLSFWALAKDYGMKIPFSGPLYRSCRRDGDRMVISFDYADSGLMVADKDGLAPVAEVPNGVMKQFSIKDAAGKWHWAAAKIDGATVVVQSPEVAAPVAVRYAFSLNPKGPKLYNRDGLPASPFSTEEW